MFALLLGLIPAVYANLYKESSNQYLESLERIQLKIDEALRNQDFPRSCSLINDYQSKLNEAWYYLRDAGISYEDLSQRRRSMQFEYRKNCV